MPGLQANQYRPMPVLRTDIPKADGGQRPLGLLALEDKIVQGAAAELLSAIYEADFHDVSFGFRPGRSAHDALRTVSAAIISERVNWVVDVDIRNFFGSVDHAWLIRMLELRIADPRILRLVRLWLRAGDGGRCVRRNRGGHPRKVRGSAHCWPTSTCITRSTCEWRNGSGGRRGGMSASSALPTTICCYARLGTTRRRCLPRCRNGSPSLG